jgi:hypothetical protein
MASRLERRASVVYDSTSVIEPARGGRFRADRLPVDRILARLIQIPPAHTYLSSV